MFKPKLLAAIILGVGLLVIGIAIVLIMIDSSKGPIFSDLPAPQLGLVMEDLTVVEVLPGSPAEKVGIQPGDVLKKVGKQDVTSANDLQEKVRNEVFAVTSAKMNVDEVETIETKALPIVVKRGSTQLNFMLKPASPPFNRPTNSSQPVPTPMPAPSGLVYI